MPPDFKPTQLRNYLIYLEIYPFKNQTVKKRACGYIKTEQRSAKFKC